MPVCGKCSSKFPNRIKIDSKFRYLNKRKYCLNCSEFDKHNTKRLHISDYDLLCSICKKGFNYVRGRTSHDTCYSCRINKKRFELKKKCIEYKGGKCIVCEYNRCEQALVFHHVDPNEKEFNIGGKHCLSWEKLKIELDKCVMLCNRCHAEFHAGLIDLSAVPAR